MNKYCDAWTWVLKHSSLIKGISARLGAGSGLDTDDLHSASVERIVLRWHSYDPDCSRPSTWVWWQVLATRKEMVKHRARSLRMQQIDIDDPKLTVQPVAEQRVLLAQMKLIASDEEWAAISARAQGYEGRELGALLGCAPFSARRRVNRFIQRLE